MKQYSEYNEFETEKEDSEEIKNFSFKNFINGQYLNNKEFTTHLPYVIFLVILALIYINNHYSIEKLMREHMEVSNQMQELKFEAVTTSSELTRMSRESEIARRVREAGLELEVLRTPPRHLKVD